MGHQADREGEVRQGNQAVAVAFQIKPPEKERQDGATTRNGQSPMTSQQQKWHIYHYFFDDVANDGYVDGCAQINHDVDWCYPGLISGGPTINVWEIQGNKAWTGFWEAH